MALEIRSKIDATQNPYHIYYDINMYNGSDKDGATVDKVTINETRANDYIKCPSNYFLSIVRFQMDTTTLPVFMPEVVLGQSNPNLTIYKVALKQGSTWAIQNVIYVPADETVSVVPPLTVQDYGNTYYYVYNINNFMKMINTAFKACATTLSETDAPFLKFDNLTSLINLYVPQSYVADGIQLFVNPQLEVFLDSLPMKKQNTGNATLNMDGVGWQLTYGDDNGLNSVSINSVPYFEQVQENTTISTMNPVGSIVFTCGVLPVNQTLAQPVVDFGQREGHSQSSTNPGNNSDIIPIITDLKILPQNGNTYKEGIIYEPTAEYRLFDMNSDSPLAGIQVTVYWRNRRGKLIPFSLAYNNSCSLLIMFRRKDYNGSIELPVRDR